MHHSHHLDIHNIRLIKSELQEVYLNLIIQSFALSLITIFVPIYLLKMGFSLNQVLVFVMIELGALSFFTPFSVMLAKRFGFKHIILYRTPILLIYFAGLYALSLFNIPIYPFALAGGIASSMYWTSLHSLFAKYSSRLHRGMQASRIVSFPKIAAILGPSMGGVIAIAFGFKFLFVLAMVILCISVIPLFFTGDMKPHITYFSYADMLSKKNIRLMISFTAQGTIWVSGMILWPIFVYYTLNDVASVGFVVTVASIGTVLFTFYVGAMTDTFSRHTLLKLGGAFLALTFFLRIFASDAVHIYTISFLAGLFMILIDIPLIATFYDRANTNLAEYIIFRQIALGVGRVGAILALLFILNKFAVGFSLGGIASLVFSLL